METISFCRLPSYLRSRHHYGSFNRAAPAVIALVAYCSPIVHLAERATVVDHVSNMRPESMTTLSLVEAQAA